MTYFETWNEAIQDSLHSLWEKIITFLPELLGALIVLLLGLVLAHFLSKLARKLVELTKVDNLVKKIDAAEKLKASGLKLDFAALIAWIVKWFIIVVTLMAVVDILNLEKINEFLQDVARFLPNVIVAVIILAIGLVVGQFVSDVIEKSAKASKVVKKTADMLAALAKWAIVIFSILVSLSQLNIATNLIDILFTGLIAGLALAFGLSFGLGGKEYAAKWLEKIKK